MLVQQPRLGIFSPVLRRLSAWWTRTASAAAVVDERIEAALCHSPAGRLLLRTVGPVGVRTWPVTAVAIWVAAVVWAEWLVFPARVGDCSWDRWEDWPTGASPHRLVLISDPRLTDPHSFPGRTWPASALSQAYGDRYLSRVYTTVLDQIDPDSIFFLGDLFDGGREWATRTSKSPVARWQRYDHPFWQSEFTRFYSIFSRPPQPGSRHRQVVAVAPGDHDVGFGALIEPAVHGRFQAYFGNGNRVDVVGNHTFMSLDTVALSAWDSQYPKRTAGLWKPPMRFLDHLDSARDAAIDRSFGQPSDGPGRSRFLHQINNLTTTKTAEEARRNESAWSSGSSSVRTHLPTVLLSHVPLYRLPGEPCGPLRETRETVRSSRSGKSQSISTMPVRGGYQFQSVLTADLSRLITSKVSDLAYVFSGNDGDFCDYTHSTYPSVRAGIREVTVKRVSWTGRVRQPGIVLVSLWHPVDPDERRPDGPSMQIHLCLLPDQVALFLRYLYLVVGTVGGMAIKAWIDTRRLGHVNFYWGKPESFQFVSGQSSRPGGSESGFDSDSDLDIDSPDIEAGWATGTLLPAAEKTRPAATSKSTSPLSDFEMVHPRSTVETFMSFDSAALQHPDQTRSRIKADDLPDPEMCWIRFRCAITQVALIVFPVYLYLFKSW